MTSQNNTLRCAASTMYSMAGPNTPSGAVNAPTEDGCAWFDGIGFAPCLLLSRRGKGTTPVARSCARRQHTPSRPTVFFLRRTHEWQAFGAASHSPRPRSLRLDLCQVLGKARHRIARPYRHTFPGPRPKWSTPFQRHADISGQSSGVLDDFDSQLVSARTEVLCPEHIDFLWHAGQRAFPASLLLNDGAALVRAQLVRKAVHLYLGAAVGHRALDDLDRTPNGLFIGNSRWLREVIEQCLLLGLRRRLLGRFLRGLFRLGQGKFLHEILCRGQQLVGFGRHVPLHSGHSASQADDSSLPQVIHQRCVADTTRRSCSKEVCRVGKG